MKFLKVKALTIISGISLGFSLNVRHSITIHLVLYILSYFLLAAHMVLWVMSDRGTFQICLSVVLRQVFLQEFLVLSE